MSDAPELDPRSRGVGLDGVATLAGMLGEIRWCCWNQELQERKNGPAKWSKVPRLPGTPIKARVNTTAGCTDYATAKRYVLGGGEAAHAGVGWFCLGDLTRALLDIDKCRDPETGLVAPWALAVLGMCGGAYVEVTPSGTGLRVLGACGLDVAFQGKLLMPAFLAAQDEEGLKAWGGSRECHAGAAIEIYFACARYVTVTGWDARGDAGVDIGSVAFELWLLADRQAAARQGERGRTAKRAAAGRERTAEIGDVVAALGVMDNDNVHWDEWSRVGMAAHAASGGDPDAFEAWRAWSERSFKHDDAACRERWEHWRGSGADDLGFGTLGWLARQSRKGWVPPSRLRCDEFDVVEAAEAGSAPLPPPGRGQVVLSLLAGRVIYVARLHRWMNTDTGVLMDEPRLRALAQTLGVAGAMAGGVRSVAARVLRADSGMRQVVSLTMRPGAELVLEEDGQPCLNTWRPSSLVPLRGATAADAKPWLDHAERLIPVEADRRRVLDRLAWALQNPGKKINSALVLLGGQLSGKDSFLVPFWRAIGEHNHTVVQGVSLGGSFNGYLERSWLLISEMPPARRRDVYEDIKGMLTTPPDRFRINRKGLEEYDVPNIINVIVTTNHEGAIALAEDDRRFDVVATMAAMVGEGVELYYRELYAWFARGGCEAVAGFLLARDVSRFNPHASPPLTAAKETMAREGAHPAVSWALGLWDEGRPMHRRDYVTVNELVQKGQAGKWGAGDAAGRGLTWGHMLQALRMKGWLQLPQQIVDGEDRPRVWARSGVVVLARQLSASQLKDRLFTDRGKSSGADFD